MTGEYAGWDSSVGVPFDIKNLPVMKHLAEDGKEVFVTFDAHHVIPTNSHRESEFLKHLERMETPLWEQNKFARNGLPLPNTREGVNILGSALHTSRHKYYSEFIDTVLKAFEDKYAKQLDHNDPAKLDLWLRENARKINGLASYLKIELTNPKSALKLHGTDPNIMDVEDSKSKFVWRETKKLFNAEKLTFDDKITKHPAFDKGAQDPKIGARLFDATPGEGTAKGTALDVKHGYTKATWQQEVELHFKLTSLDPSSTAVSEHFKKSYEYLKKTGKVLMVLGKAVGIYGLYTDITEASEAAERLLKECDPIGADAELTAFAAKQWGTMSRMAAAYAASEGDLGKTLEKNERMTEAWAQAARRAHIAWTLNEMVKRGEPLPEKYRNWFNDGKGQVQVDGTTVGISDTGEKIEIGNVDGQPVVRATDKEGREGYVTHPTEGRVQTIDRNGSSVTLFVGPDGVVRVTQSSPSGVRSEKIIGAYGEEPADGDLEASSSGRSRGIGPRDDSSVVDTGMINARIADIRAGRSPDSTHPDAGAAGSGRRDFYPPDRQEPPAGPINTGLAPLFGPPGIVDDDAWPENVVGTSAVKWPENAVGTPEINARIADILADPNYAWPKGGAGPDARPADTGSSPPPQPTAGNPAYGTWLEDIFDENWPWASRRRKAVDLSGTFLEGIDEWPWPPSRRKAVDLSGTFLEGIDEWPWP